MALIQSERHQKILDYALERIRESELCPYIGAIYLYGSCARGEEKFKSDIDLLVVLKPEVVETPSYKRSMRILRSEVTTDDWRDPETDLHFAIGNEWETCGQLFYKNIRREGMQVWH